LNFTPLAGVRPAHPRPNRKRPVKAVPAAADIEGHDNKEVARMPTAVRYGQSESLDPAQAVAEFAAQIGPDEVDAVIFFCSPDYDLAALGHALGATFRCPTVGCTSSGQIGRAGFQHAGLLGIGFTGGVRLRPFVIHPLADHGDQVAHITAEVRSECEASPGGQRFGLLLIDGLSRCEERVVASLYQHIGNVPIIGGSAGDNLRFERTHVYVGDGRFLSDAAVFSLITTESQIVPIKTQHFRASGVELVITAADPEARIIHEMNGEPAALAYAEAMGMRPEDLSPAIFSRHPLALTFGQEPYVRSIQKANEDLSLTCYCAIDEGLIVSIGEAVDPVLTLRQAFAEIHRTLPEPVVIIGCDCVLRRLEFEQEGIDGEIGSLMAANRVLGFSTYGEQYNGLHINQTFTAVAIGA
jgi:hypothetical protein